MAEIGFYHLTRTGAEQALPALLGRTLKAGQRAVVMCPESRIAALDAALWASTEPDWLPHGTGGGGDAALQPIWLTHLDEAPNGARYLFLLDATLSPDLAKFDRVFDLFDGGDEATVAAARVRWKVRKDAGHGMTYWQQGAKGWEKKA